MTVEDIKKFYDRVHSIAQYNNPAEKDSHTHLYTELEVDSFGRLRTRRGSIIKPNEPISGYSVSYPEWRSDLDDMKLKRGKIYGLFSLPRETITVSTQGIDVEYSGKAWAELRSVFFSDVRFYRLRSWLHRLTTKFGFFSTDWFNIALIVINAAFFFVWFVFAVVSPWVLFFVPLIWAVLVLPLNIGYLSTAYPPNGLMNGKFNPMKLYPDVKFYNDPDAFKNAYRDKMLDTKLEEVLWN
jgi:hypothetical protein